MFRLTKQIFITLLNISGSLASMASVSKFTTFIYLNNEPCITQSTLIDLNPDEYNQRLRYFTFIVNLHKCNRSCDLSDLSGRICVQTKQKI